MLKQFFNKIEQAMAGSSEEEAPQNRETLVRRSAAALLIEVARADHDFSEQELEAVVELIQREFELSAEEALALSNQATDDVEQSVSLHEFTSVLHGQLAPEEKSRVVGAMWSMAYADGTLDMYEDALVLKVADLLYVPRPEVMRLKALAQTVT